MWPELRGNGMRSQTLGVSGAAPWRDQRLSPTERAEALLPLMSLEEKVAQLVGVWVGAEASGEGVAPHQSDMISELPQWSTVIQYGLGQLTRPFGTAPVDPVLGARSLAASQAQIVAASRFGIPAQVHEECLTGFAAWRATVYPTPLSWGASFDPELVEAMADRIGRSMRAAGVHQGLAPVLDVTRDYRWGRTEETIGEDPYLVGTTGAAYVRGLERAGVVATLKHFAGYSASRGGRNLAPVPMGRRELADVILPPFEMALRLGGARSVMNSYAEIDGLPVAADQGLLTGLLRDEWGFTGTVVADYFAVRFLQTLHGVAGDAADAARLALRAGIDVELPTVRRLRRTAGGGGPPRRGRRGADRPRAASGADPEGRGRPARRGLAGAARRRGVPAPRRRGQPGDRRTPGPGVSRPAAQHRSSSRCPWAAGSPWSARPPTTRWPCSAATRSPTTWASTTASSGSAWSIPTLRDELARRVPMLTHEPGCAITGEDTSGYPGRGRRGCRRRRVRAGRRRPGGNVRPGHLR